MVQYRDPELHPEGLEEDRAAQRHRRAATSPGERLAKMRERNAALTGVEAIESAREVALRKLDARSCSRAELERAIEQRGFSAETAQEVVSRLEHVGLVDDAAFAAMIVRDRFTLRGSVGRAVVEDLRRKGIAQEHIEQALAQISHDEEYERALELAQRKVRTMRGVPRQKAWARLSGMLARKGYSPSTTSKIVNATLSNWSEHEEDSDDNW